MKIGIDKIGFYTPHIYVDMNKLAVARDDDPKKYTVGIGQDEMSVAPITQDPVTLAANAALSILDDEDREKIDFVMFGTESGVDHSKAAGIFVHSLLGLKKEVRTIELKQACYGATAAIQLAKGHIALHPDSKVLVLASDISKYGLATPGEVTQGAGAVALVISADPKIMVLENDNAFMTKDVMDFWRPTYSEVAYVDGKLSNEQYIAFFNEVWNAYKQKSGLGLEDFTAICFHMPYTKMGLKALQTILAEVSEEEQEKLQENYQISTLYSRRVGNIYTGALYLSLLSFLENSQNLPAGTKIGFYSYGSGSVGEFFTGVLQPDYEKHLKKEAHEKLLNSREEISVPEYETIFNEALPCDGSTKELAITDDPAPICLSGISDHIRKYVNKVKVTTK